MHLPLFNFSGKISLHKEQRISNLSSQNRAEETADKEIAYGNYIKSGKF